MCCAGLELMEVSSNLTEPFCDSVNYIGGEFQGMWSRKQAVCWESAGLVQDGAPWGDWEHGGSPSAGCRWVWGVQVTTDVKDLFSVPQGPPGPSGRPGGHGFRGPSVSLSYNFILIY